MLATVEDLTRYEVHARDGGLGRLCDLSFDDQTWQVRYLILDTRSWLGRRVLMHPLGVRRCDHDRRLVELMVTREQVENSPPVDADQPLTWRLAERYYRYFRWPTYWVPGGFGFKPDRDDPRLRRGREVAGLKLEGRDGRLGRVEDALVDTSLWSVRFLVVGARDLWSKKQVLIAPGSAERIEWDEKLVHIDQDRDGLRRGPAWPQRLLPDRNEEPITNSRV
jgi:hypothetical protein